MANGDGNGLVGHSGRAQRERSRCHEGDTGEIGLARHDTFGLTGTALGKILNDVSHHDSMTILRRMSARHRPRDRGGEQHESRKNDTREDHIPYLHTV